VLAGEGGADGDEVGGCALEDDPAAVVAGAGAEVDDPVDVRHDRLVVLDDDDRLAGVDEPVEQAEQLLDVGEVVGSSRNGGAGSAPIRCWSTMIAVVSPVEYVDLGPRQRRHEALYEAL
jgi:hypothetical protein